MTRPLVLSDGLVALAWLLGGLIVGILLDRLVLHRIVQRMTRTRWGADDVAVGAVHKLVVPWSVIAGAYGARLGLPFTPAGARLADRVLITASIIAATIALARLIGDILRLTALKSSSAMRSSSIFIHISSLLIYVIGFLVLLATLGISITPLLTALGVGGLAAALALQDTLANLFAGIHLIASKKVRPGDYIKLDTSEEGYVVDVNWRNTEMRQLPNNIILVPNAKLAEAIVTNFHMPERELSITFNLGVSYDSDLEHVERVTIDVAKQVLQETPGGVASFEPFIRYNGFGDSSIDFTVILRVQEFVDRYLVQHEFIKRLHARYRAEGIEIPFPIRTVHLMGGDEEGDRATG